MPLFRKHPTWPTRTKSAFLIYEDNRTFLEGQREKLAYPAEALDNLAAAIGETRPEGGGCAGCLGCASVFIGASAILFTALGVLLMMTGIGWLVYSPHLAPNTPLPALVLVFGIIFLLPGGAPQYILRSHATEQRQIYLRGLYNQLIARGQMVEGTIISVEQDVTSQMRIRYHFNVSGQDGDCEGQYKTVSKKDFGPGQKVIVLYLGRLIQVLL